MSEEASALSEPDDQEVKARETGWVPKEEWKGKPDNWKPAADWLERSNPRYVPALEKKIGNLEGKLAKQETEFADRLKRLESSTRAALKDERERIEREAEARILKATELGDTEGVKKALSDQKKDMERLSEKAEVAADKQELKETKEASDLPPEVKKRLESWLEDNDWYSSNRRLARQFDYIYSVVEEDMPGATILERLAAAREKLVEENPTKFGKKAAEEDDRKPSRVEGGNRNTNGSKDGWSQVPADDRKVCDNLIKGDGLFLSDEARKEWKKSKTVSDQELHKARQKWLAGYQGQAA